jgi:hypothetical protein
MIKSSSFSPGYNIELKCAVSVGRIYICGACCYCDWRSETRQSQVIPVGVIGIFYLLHLSGRTMTLRLTRPLTEMSKSSSIAVLDRP